MRFSSITDAIDRIAQIDTVYEKILEKHLKKEKKIIASPCFLIPPEIMAAFNIISLKIPEFFLNKTGFSNIAASLYDHIIISEKECSCNRYFKSDNTSYIFKTPTGFGEDAAVSLHHEISLLLNKLFYIELKSINIERLQQETLKYEQLRRLVRSISSMRSENADLLSNSDLSLIFETALILPPEIAVEYISPVFDEMKKVDDKNDKTFIHGMLYGGKTIPSVIADEIEKKGIQIIEDDSCSGRRLFDLSLNPDSEYIFYELLDAYSYRAMPPCLRPEDERYELLYKLLRNYNIETVIFFMDEYCIDSRNDIDFLRIKMMRDGIDPVLVNKDNYMEKISNYVNMIQKS